MNNKFSTFLFLIAVYIVQTSWTTMTKTNAYSIMGAPTKRSTMTMKRGRGSFKKEIGEGSLSTGSSSSAGMAPGKNWLNTNKSVKDLPEEEGKVRFFSCPFLLTTISFLWRLLILMFSSLLLNIFCFDRSSSLIQVQFC